MDCAVQSFNSSFLIGWCTTVKFCWFIESQSFDHAFNEYPHRRSAQSPLLRLHFFSVQPRASVEVRSSADYSSDKAPPPPPSSPQPTAAASPSNMKSAAAAAASPGRYLKAATRFAQQRGGARRPPNSAAAPAAASPKV
jgi:hypothetical protein